MRYPRTVVTAVLLSGSLFASCTCHKDIPKVPVSDEPFKEAPSGFRVSGMTPAKHAVGPTMSPPAQVVAQATPAAAPPEIPIDFPKEVPVFAGAVVSQVQDLPNAAHNVIFNTPAPVADVTGFYHKQLSKAGWRVTQQFERPNHAFMTYQKGSMQANVTVAEDANNPGHQVIAIMYEELQPLPEGFEDLE